MTNEIFLFGYLLGFFFLIVFLYRRFGVNALFCLSAVIPILANIEVLLRLRAFGVEQTMGNVLFGGAFLITDIIGECEKDGENKAKFAVWVSIVSMLLFTALSMLWLTIDVENVAMRNSFEAIFSNTPRLLAVSLLLFAVTQMFDIWVYHKIWRLCGNGRRLLWLRNNGSTMCSQFLNGVGFTILAFMGTMPWSQLMEIAIGTYIVYFVIALFDTPFIYIARCGGRNEQKA